MFKFFSVLLTFLCVSHFALANTAIEISGQDHRLDELIRSGNSIQFSNDNKKIVYKGIVDDPFYIGLYSTSPDGGNVTALTPENVNVYEFKISPDSQWVVYRGANGLNSVSINGGVSTRLDTARPLADSNGYQITPDSSHVVYLDIGSLWSVKLDGSEATHLNANLPPNGFDVGSFSISPNSSTVIFPFMTVTHSNQLYKVEIGSSVLTPLISDTSDIESFVSTAFSKDGQRIIYDTWTIDGFYNALYSLPVSGGQAVKLSDRPSGNDGGAQGFLFTSQPSKITYCFRDSGFDCKRLINVDINTGSQQLIYEANAGETITNYWRIPQTDDVIFLVNEASEDRFKSVSMLNPQQATVLNNGKPISEKIKAFSLTPNSTSLVWKSVSQSGDNFSHKIFSLPFDGTSEKIINSVIESNENSWIRDFLLIQKNDQIIIVNEELESSDYGIFVRELANRNTKKLVGLELQFESLYTTPNEDYVVFTARLDSDSPYKLYSYELPVNLDDEICVPIKSKSNNVAIICL